MAALEAAVAARPEVIIIAGPAGSGKRLMVAAFQDLEAAGAPEAKDGPPWQWRAFKVARAFRGARVIVVQPDSLEPLLGFHPTAQVVWMEPMDEVDVREMVHGRMRQLGMAETHISAEALIGVQEWGEGSPRRVDALFSRVWDIACDNLSDRIEAWHVDEASRDMAADLQERNAPAEVHCRRDIEEPEEPAVVDAFSLFGEASSRVELERSNARWRRARIRNRVLLWMGVTGLAGALVALVVVVLPMLSSGHGRGPGPVAMAGRPRSSAPAPASRPVREAPQPPPVVAVVVPPQMPDPIVAAPAKAPEVAPPPGGLAQGAGSAAPSAGVPAPAPRAADAPPATPPAVTLSTASAPGPTPVPGAVAMAPTPAMALPDDAANARLPEEIRDQAARLVELARTLVRRGQMSEAEAIYATAARMGNADAVAAMNILQPLPRPVAHAAPPGGTAAAN